MKINQKHFYEFNFQDFVHVKYLKHVLKDVARIIADNIPDHKTIDDLQFKTDKYGEQELHVTYTDFENQSHDVLMKPAITDRVNELIDQRFRWIESGDEPIKKLEIKNHYFRITTDSTTADFEVPYIFNAGVEQDQLHFDNDGEEYIKIKLVARNTHDEVTLEVPTKKNFDDLKSDYAKFKEAFYTWQTEVNNHLAEIDKKDKEQDGRLTDVEQKNTEQDNRLTDVEQKNTEQDGRLTDVEQKNTEQDGRLTDVEQKNTEQDNEISGIKEHQTSVDSIIAILQQKSHDFLQQLKNPADFNDIKDDGNYFVYADDTPDNHLTGANRPSDHWGILYNYKHEPSNQVQIYAADTDNVLYMRTLNSSDWTPWQAVTTSTALKDAISELTKTLFNFYYDGLATETSVDGKPVAAKAMIINDDKNLFKGIAIFNQAGELLKRIMLDDYATKEEVKSLTSNINVNDNIHSVYGDTTDLQINDSLSDETLSELGLDFTSLGLDRSSFIELSGTTKDGKQFRINNGKLVKWVNDDVKIPVITVPYEGDTSKLKNGFIIDVNNSRIETSTEDILDHYNLDYPQYLYGTLANDIFFTAMASDSYHETPLSVQLNLNGSLVTARQVEYNLINAGVINNDQEVTNFDVYMRGNDGESVTFNIKKVDLQERNLTVNDKTIEIPNVTLTDGSSLKTPIDSTDNTPDVLVGYAGYKDRVLTVNGESVGNSRKISLVIGTTATGNDIETVQPFHRLKLRQAIFNGQSVVNVTGKIEGKEKANATLFLQSDGSYLTSAAIQKGDILETYFFV